MDYHIIPVENIQDKDTASKRIFAHILSIYVPISCRYNYVHNDTKTGRVASFFAVSKTFALF